MLFHRCHCHRAIVNVTSTTRTTAGQSTAPLVNEPGSQYLLQKAEAVITASTELARQDDIHTKPQQLTALAATATYGIGGPDTTGRSSSMERYPDRPRRSTNAPLRSVPQLPKSSLPFHRSVVL